MADHDQLRLKTREAWRGASRWDAANSAEGAPGSGDIYALAETSDLAVEWVVVGQVEAERKLYVVPADTYHLLGSRDVALEEDALGGPLSLRCAWGIWVPAEVFHGALRSGVLTRADLHRARRMRAAIEQDTVEATESQYEVEGELDYLEWIEEGPAAARAVLERLLESGAGGEGATPQVVALEALAPAPGLPPRSIHRWRGLALAASLFLALTLAVGVVLIGQMRAENHRLERAIQELAQQETEPTINLWIAEVRRTRGGFQKISVPSRARELVVRVDDFYPEPAARYRLELRRDEPPETMHSWNEQDLLKRLTVRLPLRELPAGKYRLLVWALGEEESEGARSPRETRELLGEYKMEIDYEHDEHHP